MEKKHYHCEMCPAVASSEKELRKGNWIRLLGDGGISVWLDKPRGKSGVMMLTVGYKKRRYDFCSIKCLVKALNGTESI